MKSELEAHDIEAIAQRVKELLRPLLARNAGNTEDPILTVEGLAEYLHTDTSWVYKQVSLKAIPYFKAGKYTRFRKSAIDKWAESRTVRPVPSLRVVSNGKVKLHNPEHSIR